MHEHGTRVSHERQLLTCLQETVVHLPGVGINSGQGGGNHLDIEGWGLLPHQQYQYGDLRIETPNRTVVIEAESAGGLTNLVKYWPALASRPPVKPFLLLHVYRLTSADDYIAHRRLWEFTVARMREQLAAQHHVLWGDHWEAVLLTYRTESDLLQIAQFVRGAVSA